MLSVKLFWCSSILYSYDQLEEGTSVLSICALCSMWNFFSVAVFHMSIANWGGDPSALSISAFCYMLIFFGVVVFQIFLVNWRRGLAICACCYLWNFFGVAVLHTTMVNWRRGSICPQYMCILLGVKHIWCSGIP